MTNRRTNLPEGTQDDRQVVESLAKGLTLLRCFQHEDTFLGNQELSKRSGIPKATVSRLTFTLAKFGYLIYAEDLGQYKLGPSVLALGYACLSGMKVREIAQPYMQDLADHAGSGVLVALGVRDGTSMLYVSCARSSGMVSLLLGVGSRVSLTDTAMGRAYLASLPPDERVSVMEEIRAETDPSNWDHVEGVIADAVTQIGERGFYANLGDWQPDVHAVSVPFRSPNLGDPVFAFNCGGPAYLLSKERLENELGPRLVEMARNVRFSAGM
ncbi:IclR family transcriptional regulator [Nisaea acidiphila]|uniref:IclR family transcriptional regulator n=1 Tax=Nisaea acidiphila TaxID=1862145 RepID=A0A9J7AS10_9PROT|nr:IclR family transcriptional regulator [Nisaea acidiphila]UUX50047.1 IclR family transcriptional regulator [Nisaea acidiphila]